MEEEKLLFIDNIRHEINYKTNGINQEILRINQEFTDDIYELNKKYDYWLNNKNFVLYSSILPLNMRVDKPSYKG